MSSRRYGKRLALGRSVAAVIAAAVTPVASLIPVRGIPEVETFCGRCDAKKPCAYVHDASGVVYVLCGECR